jgi:NADPH2:quinone reductase
MKAVVCNDYGDVDKLAVEELPDPVAAPGQVVIDVHACGVNFPDVLIVQGKYQFKPEPPFSPGGEVAGIVSAVGEGVSGITVGQRVMATALWGGFAEKLAVPAAGVQPIPEGMDMVTASVITGAYGTSLHALRDRARIQPGETLLVLGAAGGVGLAAVEIGAAMGARVIAAASSAERLELCREHGATDLIDYASEDMRARLKEITGGEGVDVVYDPVGGPFSEPALRSTAWNGRFLVVGFAAGDIPRIPLNLVLLKGCQIVGVFYGAAVQRDPALLGSAITELGRMWAEGKIRPHVSQTFTLAEASGALEALAERRVQGKAAIVTALHQAAAGAPA